MILQQFVEDMSLEEVIKLMVEPGMGFYDTIMVPRKREEVEMTRLCHKVIIPKFETTTSVLAAVVSGHEFHGTD